MDTKEAMEKKANDNGKYNRKPANINRHLKSKKTVKIPEWLAFDKHLVH